MRSVACALLLCVAVGCGRVDYQPLIDESAPLREALDEYFDTQARYPLSLQELPSLNPLPEQTGSKWKDWTYFSDGSSYKIYIYPSASSRMTLLYRTSTGTTSEQGWFTDDESGSGAKPLQGYRTPGSASDLGG